MRETYTGKVRKVLSSGVLPEEVDVISSRTGLTVKQADRSLKYLVTQKELPAPTREQHYRRVSESLSGRARPEISLNQSTSWRVIRPLVLRNGASSEIAEVTDYTDQQVTRLIHHPRKTLAVPEYNDPAKKKERRSRAYYRGLRKRNGNEMTVNEIATVDFARKLVQEGLITDDVSDWNAVGDLFEKNGKKIESFAYRLVLEVLFRQRRYMLEKSTELLDLYARISKCSDPSWYEEESVKRDRSIIMNHGSLASRPSE